MWRLILSINLTGLWGLQIFGQTLFLGMLMSVFPDEISFWICRLCKADFPPQSRWALSKSWRALLEQRGRGEKSSASASLVVLRFWSFPALRLGSLWHHLPGSWVFGLGLNLTPYVPDSWAFGLGLKLCHQLFPTSSL